MLASPSDYDLANAVENNVIGSTPFTRQNIRTATAIHGCDVAALKQKTTKKPSKMPNLDEVRDVPSHINVNGIMFLVGVSKHISLIQCVCIRKKIRR